MYDPVKRHERYLRRKDSILAVAAKYYKDNRESINAKRRATYQANLEVERKKVRIRQQKRRLKDIEQT